MVRTSSSESRRKSYRTLGSVAWRGQIPFAGVLESGAETFTNRIAYLVAERCCPPGMWARTARSG